MPFALDCNPGKLRDAASIFTKSGQQNFAHASMRPTSHWRRGWAHVTRDSGMRHLIERSRSRVDVGGRQSVLRHTLRTFYVAFTNWSPCLYQRFRPQAGKLFRAKFYAAIVAGVWSAISSDGGSH